MSKTFVASATLIGTVIGAGILGIPYVLMKSGIAIGLSHLILLAIIMALTTLYLGEIALRTKKNHQLTGYAEKYFGKKGKKIMFIAFSFGMYAALIAYLIGEGESFSQLFFNTTEFAIPLAFAFWVILSALSYFGLKALEEGESIGVILILILIISIAVLSYNQINVENLTYNNYNNLFVPFGVILFAYLGFSAIPELERIFKGEGKHMRKSIVLGYLFCFIAYAVFAISVIGSKGLLTPPIATLVLGKPFVLLGILTMFTSYLALSIALIDMYRFDFKFSKIKAWLSVIIPPLVVYLALKIFNMAQFTRVLGIGGVISGGLTAILILLMVKKAKMHGDRKPEYSMPYSKILTWGLIIIFTIGAALEVLYTLNII